MNNDFPDQILEVDDPHVEQILTFGWLEPVIGFDVVLTVIAAVTGLGAGEDDVARQVRKLVSELECARLWLEDPEQALFDYIGRGEPYSLIDGADQFAAEAFDRAKAVAWSLAMAHTLRAVS